MELSTEKWSNRGRTVWRDWLVESCKLLLVGQSELLALLLEYPDVLSFNQSYSLLEQSKLLALLLEYPDVLSFNQTEWGEIDIVEMHIDTEGRHPRASLFIRSPLLSIRK